MPQSSNYFHVLSDIGSAPQGKEMRKKALKDHQQSKKPKARKGKKVTNSVAACPYAQQNNTPETPSKKTPQPQGIPCKFTSMTVTKRGGNSVVASSKNVVKVIQVVAGSLMKPATMHCVLDGVSGPCPTHENATFSFTEKFDTRTSSELIFKAYSSLVILNFPWKCSPLKYYVNANTHEKKARSRIEVFPDTELEVSLSINFNTEIESSSKTLSNSTETLEHEKSRSSKTHQAITIKGSFKHDGSEYSIEKNFKSLIMQVESFYRFKENFGKLISALDEQSEVPGTGMVVYKGHSIKTKKSKIAIKWPSIALALKGKWKEDGPLCKYKGELSLGFAPFLGAKVEIDLVQTFFKATPAGVINKVLSWANIEAFNLILKIGGEVSGNVAIEIEREIEMKYSPKGSIEGKLPISVEAILVKAKGKYLLIFDVDAEASIAAESGISFKAEATDRSNIPFEIEFSGLQVFLVAKASLGISMSNKKTPPGAEIDEEANEDSDEEEEKPNENKIFLFGIDSKKLYEHPFDLS